MDIEYEEMQNLKREIENLRAILKQKETQLDQMERSHAYTIEQAFSSVFQSQIEFMKHLAGGELS